MFIPLIGFHQVALILECLHNTDMFVPANKQTLFSCPLFLTAKKTKQSGDGGEEVFGSRRTEVFPNKWQYYFFCSIGGFVRVQSNVSAAILCGVRLHQNFPRPISSFSPLPDIQLSSYTAPNENETVAGLGWEPACWFQLPQVGGSSGKRFTKLMEFSIFRISVLFEGFTSRGIVCEGSLQKGDLHNLSFRNQPLK